MLYRILEDTCNGGFKLTLKKPQFVVLKILLLGLIISKDDQRPDPENAASIECYSVLKSIQEFLVSLDVPINSEKHICNYAVIAKALTSFRKGLNKKVS
ncbi:hypothetical protein CDAR_43221 [Caerostris darwini]|uniref:Uncharacterized protein n=1 Tax=Caerostris darwini TaxID=1538125 RepID=A0AAV4WJB1_9ARAC|nr:hypothetical protein CDAR_43221 [Caerostris darwini]